MKGTQSLISKARVLALQSRKHVVILASVGNPDFGQNPNSSLYGAEKNRVETIDTYREASDKCNEFIEKNDLGSGNWFGGEIVAPNGVVVAHVSYNGRIWTGQHYFPNNIEITDLDKKL